MSGKLSRSWAEWTPDDVARYNAQKAPQTRQDAPGTAIARGGATGTQTKYKNKSCVFQGLRFDSQRELNTWLELKQRESSGEIDQLERQVPYELHAHCWDGVGRYVCTYIADFRYRDRRDGKTYVVDSKGYRTATFLLKKNFFETEYGLSLRLA